MPLPFSLKKKIVLVLFDVVFCLSFCFLLPAPPPPPPPSPPFPSVSLSVCTLSFLLPCDRLVGLVVKASTSRAEDSACAGLVPGRVIPVTSKLALQWLPCQAPGVIRSVLGLVGPVSVYCD